MKLITKKMEREMPALYETETLPDSERRVHVKYFHTRSTTRWYGLEIDINTQEMFGYMVSGELSASGPDATNDSYQTKEYGYFSLENYPGIERDLHWNDKTTLEQIKNGEVA